MGRWVLVLLASIGGFGNYLIIPVDNHGSDGDIPRFSCCFCQCEGSQHPVAMLQIGGMSEGWWRNCVGQSVREN